MILQWCDFHRITQLTRLDKTFEIIKSTLISQGKGPALISFHLLIQWLFSMWGKKKTTLTIFQVKILFFSFFFPGCPLVFLCLSETLNTAMVEMSQLPQAARALWQLQTSAVALQVFACNTSNFWLTIQFDSWPARYLCSKDSQLFWQ